MPKRKNSTKRSPFGIVKDNEFLARIVLLFEHVLKDGCTKESALKLEHLMKEYSWSFMRKKHDNMSGVLVKHVPHKNIFVYIIVRHLTGNF